MFARGRADQIYLAEGALAYHLPGGDAGFGVLRHVSVWQELRCSAALRVTARSSCVNVIRSNWSKGKAQPIKLGAMDEVAALHGFKQDVR